MNEYKTIDSLLKKFANPIKEDYEALAVSLMKNFSIVKCEKDSEGVRNVKYRIADSWIGEVRKWKACRQYIR